MFEESDYTNSGVNKKLSSYGTFEKKSNDNLFSDQYREDNDNIKEDAPLFEPNRPSDYKVEWYQFPGWIFVQCPRTITSGCLAFAWICFVIGVSLIQPEEVFENAMQILPLEQFIFEPSSFWYDSVEIQVPESHINSTNIFLMKKLPKYELNTALENDNKPILLLPDPPGLWIDYILQLTQGSRVEFHFSTNKTTCFFLIEGEDNLQKWRKNHQLGFRDTQCTQNLPGFLFNITNDLDYHFVFLHPDSDVVIGGEVTFTVLLNSYSTVGYKKKCGEEDGYHGFCKMKLKQGSEEVVILELSSTNEQYDHDIVNWVITPRLSLYWAIFGPIIGVMTILVIAIILAFFYQWITADVAERKKKLQQKRNNNNSSIPKSIPKPVQLVETKMPSKDKTHYDEL